MSKLNLQLKVNELIDLMIPKKNDAIEVFILILQNNDRLGKYLEFSTKIKTPFDVIDYFEKYEYKSYYDKSFPLLIWYKNKIVGILSLNRGNSIQKSVEIAFWIDNQYSRKGIVTQSVKSMIKYLFSMTDVQTILICCDISNIRSYKIPQNLNFKFVKEEENKGYYRDGKPVKLTYRLDKEDTKF